MARAYLDLGLVLEHIGDLQGAEAVYRAALKVYQQLADQDPEIAKSRIGGWTQAGSSDTMPVALIPLSCHGAGHAIVAPASVADQHLHLPGFLAA